MGVTLLTEFSLGPTHAVEAARPTWPSSEVVSVQLLNRPGPNSTTLERDARNLKRDHTLLFSCIGFHNL